MGNSSPKNKLDEWGRQLNGRATQNYNWNGTSMARPAARNNSPRPSGSPRPGQRAPLPKRRYSLNLMTLLVAAFIVILAAALVTGVALVSQLASQPPSNSQQPPAQQPLSNLNAIVTGPLPAGQTKILLLGSDQREGDTGYRTDTMMLVTIDSDTKSVSVVSFPRDLWVKVPSLYEMKINQVQALGGFQATAEMFEANFGFRPDYYVLTNFGGFMKFVDEQGGIDVEVGQDLTDECSLPQAVNSQCTVPKGTVHMDGKTALWYVRSRHSSSDFDRLRRAQEVVFAVLKKVMSTLSLDRLPKIKSELESSVETNLSFESGLSFLPVAISVLQNPAAVKHFAIDENQATPSWSWNGLWILLPDTNAIQNVLRQAGVHLDH